jgi:glycosyltransferase involved in cell wall biosynthesis
VPVASSAVRIAVVAPLFESVPPTLYGGTERVVGWLVEALVRRGHEVTLFASGDSRTSARLIHEVPRALRLSREGNAELHHVMMLGEVFRRAREFDVIHSHVDVWAFPFSELVKTKVLHTLHGRLDLPWSKDVHRRHPSLELVSISDAQRAALPGVRFTATVHHGMPRDLYRFHRRADDYFLFLGRTSAEKGLPLAIEVARRAGARLRIAAKIDDEEQEYFEREVRPLLRAPGIEFLGEISDGDKNDLLGRARALLLPIDWPEPFGLAFIEALACGTPVITRPRGSVPEIVRPGITGIVAEDVDGLVKAVRTVDEIDRADCRADFEARFTDERMADAYEDVYERLIEADAGRAAPVRVQHGT